MSQTSTTITSVEPPMDPSTIEIDVERMREKYRQERDKRIRPLGTDQFTFTEGAFAHFEDDPHAGPPAPRESIERELDILIIGTGFGGVESAVTLLDAGVDDFLMLDVAADFGGTWYWNRYPGIRCDVESYIYLPYLERTGYMPTERYVTGPEIFKYFGILADHFGLRDHALFQTKLTHMTWHPESARWIVATNRGDQLRARFVITQSGIFSKPQLPGIPGIESFKGKMFHSSRWDYEYTGGDATGNLDKLSDKRVAIIGTGATGLQAVPKLAESARELVVFQRTPTSVGVRDNAPTDEAWFRSQPAGWQKERERSFNALSCFEPVDCPVDDGWARAFRHMRDAILALPEADQTPENIELAMERADYQLNEMIRQRVERLVPDQATADRLKAYYRTFCKRPGFSDDYLPAFARDNVTLVDTAASGIDAITEDGITVGGRHYELDCIIFATGFELGTTWAHQAGYEVVAYGQKLSEKWAEGLRTYHGMFSAGFPNIFFLGLTQTGTTISVPHMLQEQADHIAFVVHHALANDLSRVEATAEAEEGWQEVMKEKNEARRPFQESCTPGYFNAEGKPKDRRSAIGSGIYQPSTVFFKMLEDWRESGEFTGLVME